MEKTSPMGAPLIQPMTQAESKGHGPVLTTAESPSPTPALKRPKPIDTPRDIPQIINDYDFTSDTRYESVEQPKVCDSKGYDLRANEFFRVIGQYKDLYIFCQAGDNLLIIDQHAAHERLLYEKLKKQHLDGRIAAQSLLFPVTIELSVSQAQLVEQNRDEISELGFQIRDFGGNSFIISGIPALAGQCEPAALFFDILGQFGDVNERYGTKRLNDILSSLACKAAVKSGDRLHDKEIENLLAQMARADLFSHCPHGRPVVKQFSDMDVKKWFHRT